ncbi:MAG: protein kinase, partial [Pirellulaceae bacterium]
MENLSTEIQPETLLGTLVDRRYRLARFLGSGSFGFVFEAAEESLGSCVSRVAVKIILPRNEEERAGVRCDVRGLAQLNHDHILVYRTSGEIDEGPLAGAVFVVTELADTSLERELQTARGIEDGEVRRMALGIACALANCHRLGAIHRDVKPANIFRVQDCWKLANFGLRHSKADESRQTAAQEGTYAYMAPEVLEGETSPKIDVYSFGVTILECLTGELAHCGSTPEAFRDHLASEPARIHDDLEVSWKDLLAACLEHDPAKRSSAIEIAERLGGSATDEPVTSAPVIRPVAMDTLIVSSFGRGQCLTIDEALKIAPENARIFVRPGKYRENVVLDKPAEIIGDGPVQEIILESSRVPLLVSGAKATVRGLTIRGRGRNGDLRRFAVEVSEGHLTLAGCEITCDSLACVAVCKQGAEATL